MERVLEVSLDIFSNCFTALIFYCDVWHVHSIAVHHELHHVPISILHSDEKRSAALIIAHIHHLSVRSTVKI